ncbi:hypothetical protein HKW98_09115 [Stutzerimonas urumqiensis]|uniref:hypothetical protein n=1 Tax=Stutzerimonas urumqiensis TaxID=638269 RepID=UPI003BA952FD
MNSSVIPLGHAQEYRDTMQQAALAFLQRHQGEHLVDDGKLFERAVRYLVTSLEVPAFMADRLVHLAMTQLEPCWVGLDRGAGDETIACLVHVPSGERVFVPYRRLPLRLQPPATALAAAATH